MTKKLLSSEDAVKGQKQHTKPCSDCPWSREALPGSQMKEEFVARAEPRPGPRDENPAMKSKYSSVLGVVRNVLAVIFLIALCASIFVFCAGPVY